MRLQAMWIAQSQATMHATGQNEYLARGRQLSYSTSAVTAWNGVHQGPMPATTNSGFHFEEGERVAVVRPHQQFSSSCRGQRQVLSIYQENDQQQQQLRPKQKSEQQPKKQEQLQQQQLQHEIQQQEKEQQQHNQKEADAQQNQSKEHHQHHQQQHVHQDHEQKDYQRYHHEQQQTVHQQRQMRIMEAFGAYQHRQMLYPVMMQDGRIGYLPYQPIQPFAQ